ncbi:MAG: hypothetical protein QXM96_02740, partial [Candidatus Woesearchaeota archaeon]
MGKGLYYKIASAISAGVIGLNLLGYAPRNNAQGYVEPTNTKPAITQTYQPSNTPFQPQTYTPTTLPS